MDVSLFSWTPGPATKKVYLLMRAVMLAKGIVPDLPHRLPAFLQEAGFVNIHTEERRVSLYGQDGADMRNNTYIGMLGLKTPVMDAGGMGFVQSEEQFDSLLTAMRQEWSETPDAVAQNFMFYAQKPASP